MGLEYITAKENLLTNLDDDCRHFFAKSSYILENGYCLLLDENLDLAKENFKLIKDRDIRAHWALFMISLIEGNVIEYPTYFEIRNFLEIDLNILIHYFKGDYVEKIVRYADFMFTINPEIYKFIGRVFYNNNLKDYAMFLLERAKSYFWNDPELHFLIAYIHYNDGDFNQAKKSLDDCLSILPEYFPALDMKRKILPTL